MTDTANTPEAGAEGQADAAQNQNPAAEDRMERFKRFIKERGWGPLGSLMFHALAVLLLVGFASNQIEEQEIVSVEVILDPKATEPEKVEEKKEEVVEQMDMPTDVITEEVSDTDAVTTIENFEMPGDPTTTGGVGGGTANFGIGSGAEADGVGFEMAFVKSPLVMKGLYASRRAGGSGGRAGAIRRGGGSNAGETAVLKALRWLKANQNADGSWTGAGSSTAMCGLALLCYMAHGETPNSKEFGATVEKAIRYLMYAQDIGTGRFKDCGDNYVYGHAIATYALAESYGMTQMVILKEPMEKAVRVIIDGQQGGGAWDYQYSKGDRKDVSVSAWQVQALKAAKMAGSESKGLSEALYKAVDGIKSFAGASGQFGYNSGAEAGSYPQLNGAGMLCLEFLDRANDPAVESTLQATQNILPAWPKEGGGTYGWYYTTQARYQKGGPQWDAWNKAMLPMLVKNQNADGSWTSGSTHKSCPVYDTTLCCLCLEVYYRYLPTYIKPDEVKRAPKAGAEAEAKIASEIAL
ncbi:MAG: prenyltransferase/squalene oxidase repeat-containing protein [bacterium]